MCATCYAKIYELGLGFFGTEKLVGKMRGLRASEKVSSCISRIATGLTRGYCGFRKEQEQFTENAPAEVLKCVNDPAGVDVGMSKCSIKMSLSLFEQVLPMIGDSDRLLGFFRWSLVEKAGFEHVRGSVVRTVELLQKMHRHEAAEAISHQWKEKYFPELMIAYSKCGKWEAMISLLKEMADEGGLAPPLSVGDFNSCFKGLCMVAKQVPGALRLLEEGKKLGFEPEAKTYSILLLRLCKEKRKQEVEEMMGELASSSEVIKGDPCVYNAVIAGHAVLDGWKKAFHVFDEFLRERDFVPDSRTYRILVDALVDGGRMVEACELVGRIDSPDEETLRAIVHGFLKQHEVSKARDFLLAATQRHAVVKSITYNCVMDALCRSSRVAEAYELLKVAEELGFQADIFTYNILINGLCKSSMLDEAKGLLEIMLDKGCVPDARTYGPLFHGLGKAGRVEEANSLLRKVSESSVDVVTYNGLISGHCKSGDLEGAYGRVEEMASRGLVPNVFTYNILLEHVVSCGDTERGLKMLQSMNQEGILPDVVSFNTLIAGLLRGNSMISNTTSASTRTKAGGFQRAQELLWDMVSEHACQPSLYTLNTVLDWLCKKKRGSHGMNKAMEMLGKMTGGGSNGVQPLPRANYVTYNIVVGGLCDRGMLDEAHDVYDMMLAASCTPTVVTFNALIRGLCAAGLLDKALTLLVSMPVQPDLESYRPVVEGLCVIGKLDEVLALLHQMPCSGDAAMFATLVKALCKVHL